MPDFVTNNETTKRANSLPFLINNPIYWRYDVMTRSFLPYTDEKRQEYIGRTFGRLTILEEIDLYIDPRTGKKIRMVLCKCSCGNQKALRLNALISGNTKSCGCFATERQIESSTKHGHCGHLLYKVWSNMKDRCLNNNNIRYEHYGEKGITICDEWINDPDKFIKWAKNNGWKKGLYLDRKDVDGNYEPDNCRFVAIFKSNQNMSLLSKNNTSGFRGVSFDKERGLWLSRLTINGTVIYIGRFPTAIAAAKAYDLEVIKYGGDHPLNFQHN